MLTIAFLYSAEDKKLTIDNINLESNSAIYNARIEKYNKAVRDARHEFILDSIDNNRLKMAARRAKINKLYDYTIDGKIYSAKQYADFVIKDDNRLRYKYNSKLENEDKALESSVFDDIKLKEQRKLLINNYEYIITMTWVAGFAIAISVCSSAYGFKKWSDAQEVIDELAKLQLEKVRKELEPTKSNLLL